MSFPINIRGTIINFPSTAQSPDWSPAIIAFSQAVEDALLGLVNNGDISPQVQTIDVSNPGSGVVINNLSFSTSDIRAAFINYSVFRQTDTNQVAEAGTMTIVYNPSNPSGSKWERTREFEGDAQISFTVSDTGQFSFSTTAISGPNHQGWIAFSAKALSQV